MCNRYANIVPYSQYLEIFSQLGIPVVFPTPDAAPNLEPLENIAPSVMAPVLRPVKSGVELRHLRWGMIPRFHTKSVKEWKVLTTNARVETLASTKTFKDACAKRRCLVPVSRFFEWTGEKGNKTKWSFSRSDGEWFCFAGLWDQAHTTDGDIESYALVTTAAGPDVAPYHNRQPVILERSAYAGWMDHAALPESSVMPSQAGVLKVEKL
jgi:putative SOS response-associated peptidase YedK